MAAFYPILERVLDVEGGYQKMPEDSGNYNSLDQLVGTNHGISAIAFESYYGYPPSEADMRALTQSQAITIYRRKYWDTIAGDEIHNQDLAHILFDGRVNHGRTGLKLMQRVLGVPQDGRMGPITLGALNSQDPGTIYYAYKQERANLYYWLVDEYPRNARFLNGWLNRLNEFTAAFHTTANGEPIDPTVAAAATWLPTVFAGIVAYFTFRDR